MVFTLPQTLPEVVKIALAPAETGMTPEERAEMALQYRAAGPRALNQYAVSGAKARFAGKHPVAALALSSLLSRPKYAAAVVRAFGDELNRIKESKQ